MKVIVVGGGPGGIFSAIAIRRFHPDFEVLLLEKDADIASRLKVAGNGRCNFTHRELKEEAYSSAFVRPYLENQKEVLSLLEESGFGYFFDEEGRGYPVSENAQSFIRTLKDLLQDHHVEIRTSCPVDKIETGEKIRVNGSFDCDRLVLAIGGNRGAERSSELQSDRRSDRRRLHAFEPVADSDQHLFFSSFVRKQTGEMHGESLFSGYASASGTRRSAVQKKRPFRHRDLQSFGRSGAKTFETL